jgi:AbrB family looped-hinge helix DNA binding protein
MRITSKGQVTIPQQVREAAGLLPDTEVDIVYDGSVVTIIPAADQFHRGRGARAVQALRGRATVRMSTAEIMALTRDE